MRSATGNDINQSDVIEVPEGRNDVAIKISELIQCRLKEPMPEPRGFGKVGLSGLNEECLIFSCCNDLSGQVLWKLSDEDRMRELFEQNGREIQIALKTNFVAFKIA